MLHHPCTNGTNRNMIAMGDEVELVLRSVSVQLAMAFGMIGFKHYHVLAVVHKLTAHQQNY